MFLLYQCPILVLTELQLKRKILLYRQHWLYIFWDLFLLHIHVRARYRIALRGELCSRHYNNSIHKRVRHCIFDLWHNQFLNKQFCINFLKPLIMIQSLQKCMKFWKYTSNYLRFVETQIIASPSCLLLILTWAESETSSFNTIHFLFGHCLLAFIWVLHCVPHSFYNVTRK